MIGRTARRIYRTSGLARDGERVYKREEDIPFYQKQTRLVFEHCGHIAATSIHEYLGIGGYSAFEKALFEMSPDDIIPRDHGFHSAWARRRRFSSRRKWSQVKRQNTVPKYVVCNGDEGDRCVYGQERHGGRPHRILEGMMIAALACGASEGYIYVRAEYPIAV